MDAKTAETIRKMRKALDMIEADLTRETPPHVDDRDEAYYLAGIVAEKAKALIDMVGNTQANDG